MGHRRATDVVMPWSDRKAPRVKREARGEPWTEPQLKWLEEMCLTTLSYGDIAVEYGKAFPQSRRTRNAIIGRATRSGLRDSKPQTMRPKSPRQRVRKVKYAGQETRRPKRQELAPVVFKDRADLRDEGDRGQTIRRGGSYIVRKTPEQIAKARKGHLPCIIEEAPLTSVAMDQTGVDCCKWPTSEDILCMEVCGEPAEIGAYCARHAAVAYRVMPTKRRNRDYTRRGHLDDDQRIRERDARMLVIDDAEAPAMSDAVAGLLEHFTDDAS